MEVQSKDMTSVSSLSSIQVINDVNKTLYRILKSALDPSVKITFGSPAEEESFGDNAPRLFVFLYNVIEDPFRRNDANQILGGDPLLSIRPPLALNLYYMLTPSSISVTGTGMEPPDGVPSHTILAQAMRAFYDNAIIRSDFYPRNTTLKEKEIRIAPAQVNLEEITKIWSSFSKPMKLSVCYEVSTIRIQPEDTPRPIHLVEKTVLEKSSKRGFIAISESDSHPDSEDIYHFQSENALKISNVVPSSVLPGMGVSITGSNFSSGKLKVSVDDSELEAGKSYVIVNNNLLKIKVPPHVQPGERRLSIRVDGQELNYTLVVLAPEAQLIRITEIKPNRARPGDLVSVYGINLGEEVKVKIGNQNVSTLTFIDNSQINIMIPPNISIGPTMLTIAGQKESDSLQLEIFAD